MTEGRKCWHVWLAATFVLLLASEGSAAVLSSKRGFADTGAGYSNLQATGAGWYYTWGLGDGNPGNFDAKHAPMFWGDWAVNQGNINSVKNNPNVEWVLGFNEPERPDQANLTVAQAISSWTTLSNGFAGSGKKLVSPAVSDTGEGQQWLANFMSQAQANNLQVDAVAFHWYGVSNPDNPAGAASSFLSRVQSYANYGKPVFITEFAIHDWGGNYSDEAITEANRQFLDIVIPELESRSYVAGYAWYHWFSDARLYAGSPPLPTQMGQTYIGVVKSGTVENMAGKNYGEHVAYLAGGELTATGSGPTSFSYLNALEKTSSISGTVDWQLAGSDDWVRIQPGATLRKTGTNQIGFIQNIRGNQPTITNSGVLEVAQGRLYSEVPIGGTGMAVVKGGTLALALSANLNQAPLVDIRSGGTFDVTGLPNGYIMPTNQVMKVAGTVLGNVTVSSSALFSGGGMIGGNLAANATGAFIRVGDDGTGKASRYLVDNFETYALGNVSSVASPPWTAHQNTSFADIENASGNKVLTYGYTADFRSTSRSLSDDTALGNGETATYFFRVNSKTNDPDHSVGLGDQASTDGTIFGDYEAQVRLNVGAGSTFNLDARSGGGFVNNLATGLALNSWYNIWMVVNQATDTYDVYMNTGTGAATAGNKLNASPLAFRNGTTSDLNTFLALAGSAPIDNGVRVDDIYFFDGVDLTNPLGGFDPGITWNPEVLTITGDYSQAAGATLELNLLSTTEHDVLDVGGTANLAGTLKVTLAVGAALPQEGDVFDILDFASATGGFSAFDLPTLDPGLLWKTSDLITTGMLAVVAALPGDFDSDGDVDGRDFLVWQRDPNVGDLADWQANYGVSSLTAISTAAKATSAVPEPAGVVMMVLAALLPASLRWRSAARLN